MQKDETILNHVLVELFNKIIKIEEHCLSKSEFSNISIKEIHVIEAVCNTEVQNTDNSSTSIASALKITPGSLTTSVSLLEKKGYLLRNKDEKDKRIVRIHSTKNGRLANKLHSEFHHEMVEDTISTLNTQEINVLVKALESLTTFFENKYDR